MKRSLMDIKSQLDENTVLLLHAEDFKDSVSNDVMSYNNVTIDDKGKFGKCFYCKDYVFIPASVVKSLYKKEFTVDFWFKVSTLLTSGEDTKVLMIGLNSESWSSAYGGVDVNMSTGGSLNVELYNGSRIFIKNVHQLIANTWYHLAIVIKNNVVYIFVNGILQTTKSFSGSLTPMNNSYNSRVGNGVKGYYPFIDKYIDEFRISNVARWTSNFDVPTKPY